MSPERWQRIESLYHSALALGPEQRRSFLDDACGYDSDLRRELDSLLEAAASVTQTRTIETSAAITPGSLLGPYRIEELLGAGGMGEVFRATDTRLHRTIALKILSRRQMVDPLRKRRFLMEARAVSALNHPNIVTLHDIANDGEVDYLVMEYVAGAPLDKLIVPGGLPLPIVLDYAIQISGALATAHAAGIVHRDIKPANVVLTSDGKVKVLDFGLAKPQEHRAGDHSLTETGMVIGTPAYMSPEQARGQKVDARSDLFSFGALLYEMATGRRAFPNIFDWSTPACDTLPPPLKPIVIRLLETDPDRRFPNASDVERALRLVGQPRKPGSIRWAVVSGAALTIALAGYFFFLHPKVSAAKLTETDTIVLADFDNKTGEPVFDDTLREGLSIELQQSPFLSVVPDRRVRQTLALMGPVADARLTPDVAQHVCERVGSAAILQGSLVRLGSDYVLALHAKRCASGDNLFEEQAQVRKKEDVLAALSALARKFRIKAGEALNQVKEHSTPLPEATTNNLDALKAYATAMKITNTSGDVDARPWFQRATDRDPLFAMAWANLGLAWSNAAEPLLSAESTTKAWRLRDRASDRERFFIDFTYDRQVTGNLEKAYRTLELWAQTYPRGEEPRAQGLLGGLSSRGTGRFEQCEEYSANEIEITPGEVHSYGNLAICEFYRNRFEQARATLDLAARRKMFLPDNQILDYALDFVQGKRQDMDRVAASAQGVKLTDHWMLYSEAFILAHDGRLRMARIKAKQAEDLADREGQAGPAANYRASLAFQEAAYGNKDEAKTGAYAALQRSHSRDVEYASAFALARAGDLTRSRDLADDLEKRFPEDTFARFSYVPELRALNALSRREPGQAVDLLQASLPYELTINGLSFYLYLGSMHPTYLRAEAYLALGKGSEAAVECRKIIAQPGLVYADPVGVLAHLQLARALILSGDRTQAKAEYEMFFSIWKEADTDIPVLVQAKAEYHRL